jgi:hypothetical protein
MIGDNGLTLPLPTFYFAMERWEDHPLFMKELPRNWEQNELLVGLQELIYEGPPNEVGERFKVSGNE